MTDDQRQDMTDAQPARRSRRFALATAFLSVFVLGVIAGEIVVWHCDVPSLVDETMSWWGPPKWLWRTLVVAAVLALIAGLQLGGALDRSRPPQPVITDDTQVAVETRNTAGVRGVPTLDKSPEAASSVCLPGLACPTGVGLESAGGAAGS